MRPTVQVKDYFKMADKVMTLPQVADYLQLSENTLRWMRHNGSGPLSFKLGRRVAYMESDVIAYLESQRKEGTQRLEAMKDAVR